MRFNFWNYDPDDRGWYIYGHGTVTEDGVHVVPDSGIEVYEFTGAMVADPGLGPAEGPPPDNCSQDGDPVDLATGLLVLRNTDLLLPDVMPIELTRTYRQMDARCRAFGVGTTHPYDMFITGDHRPWTYQEIILPDGGRLHYDRVCSPSPCSCPNPDPDGVCAPGNGYFEHTSTPGRFYKSTIRWNGHGWDLTLRDGTVYVFPDGECARFDPPVGSPNPRPAEAALLAIRDRFGNTTFLSRDPASKCSTYYFGILQNNGAGNLLQITSPNGRWIKFSYESAPTGPCVSGESRIASIVDNAGRRVNYMYDDLNRLTEVDQIVDGTGAIAKTTYTYDGTSPRLKTISDPRRNYECPAPCSSPPSLTVDYWLNDATNGTETVPRTGRLGRGCAAGRDRCGRVRAGAAMPRRRSGDARADRSGSSQSAPRSPRSRRARCVRSRPWSQ